MGVTSLILQWKPYKAVSSYVINNDVWSEHSEAKVFNQISFLITDTHQIRRHERRRAASISQ